MLVVRGMLSLPGAHLRAVPGKNSCTGGWIKGTFREVHQVTVRLLAAADSLKCPGYKVHVYRWALLQACPLQGGNGHLGNHMLKLRDMAHIQADSSSGRHTAIARHQLALLADSMTDLAASMTVASHAKEKGSWISSIPSGDPFLVCVWTSKASQMRDVCRPRCTP